MAIISLMYILDFSVKLFILSIYTNYVNEGYFDKRSHLNLLLWNRWTKLTQTWQGGSLSKLCPTAPLLLKIEISSNGQNCSILSQKVPKFELYKHNDELLNIYYGIFYELWTFTDFDRLWNFKKGGMKLKKKSSPLKLLSQSQPNFAEMFLGWSPSKTVSSISDLRPRWPPQPNLT